MTTTALLTHCLKSLKPEMAISAIFGRVKSATLFMTRLDPAQNGFVPNPIETPAAGVCGNVVLG